MDLFTKIRTNPVWKAIAKLQEIVLVVCGALSCLIFVVEVLMRYVLKMDFLGYDEIILLFAIWLYFIGGSFAMYRREHISAEMMGLFLKGRSLEFGRMIVTWLTFVITVILAYWGIDFFQYAMSRPATTTVWRMPKLWAQAALTVGYIMMSLYGLFNAAEDTAKFISSKKAKSNKEVSE